MPEFVMIPALLNLHHTDRVLCDTREALKNVTRDQVAAEEHLARIDADIFRLENEHRELRAKIAAEELETEIKKQHIEKMRSALNETKTTKDYSAILVQISAEKALVAEIEGRTEVLMDQAQELGKAIKEHQEKQKRAAENLAALRASSAGKVEDIRRRIEELQTARIEAAEKVPTEALKQYERIAQRHPGAAMAPVEFDDDDMENIACGGCFMGLNREDLNILRGRDEIRRCRSCGRILYFAQVPSTDTKAAAK